MIRQFHFRVFIPAAPKSTNWKDTRACKFTAALCSKAKTWKPPKCRWTERGEDVRGACVCEVTPMPTLEHYSAIKKETLSCGTWMDPAGILLSEISDKEDKCHVMSLIRGLYLPKHWTQREQTGGYRGEGWRGVWGDEWRASKGKTAVITIKWREVLYSMVTTVNNTILHARKLPSGS